jgi:hypothetical protein
MQLPSVCPGRRMVHRLKSICCGLNVYHVCIRVHEGLQMCKTVCNQHCIMACLGMGP